MVCICHLTDAWSLEFLCRPKNVYKDPDDGRQRFLLELEFVQCLANPTYIHCKFLKIFGVRFLILSQLNGDKIA